MTFSPRNLLIYTRTVRTYNLLSTPLTKGYSICLILGICHYRYTRTIAPLSFDRFIRANLDGVVRKPV